MPMEYMNEEARRRAAGDKSAPCSSRCYRADLEGRLPVVYNGKSAEEWYTLYCQEVLKHQTLVDAASNLVSAIDDADSSEGCGDRVFSEIEAIACLRELVAR